MVLEPFFTASSVETTLSKTSDSALVVVKKEEVSTCQAKLEQIPAQDIIVESSSQKPSPKSSSKVSLKRNSAKNNITKKEETPPTAVPEKPVVDEPPVKKVAEEKQAEGVLNETQAKDLDKPKVEVESKSSIIVSTIVTETSIVTEITSKNFLSTKKDTSSIIEVKKAESLKEKGFSIIFI
jgi:hypothetical protein